MSLNDEVKAEFLKSIQLKGGIDKGINPIIANQTQANNQILNLSSGLPRIHARLTNKFSLIVSQPPNLQVLNPFQIRCCLCNSIISYPAWHYMAAYRINHFHFFVCFDSLSPNKVTARCYER